MISLISAVRACRKNNHNWIAVDENKSIWTFNDKPHHYNYEWDSSKGCEYLGEFNLKCDWRNSLIEVSKIKVD